jgi:signal transduction histidine kinase
MNSIETAHPPDVRPELPADADGELLRRLAGCLAHHVNNSLTGVIGYLELGLRGLSPRSTVGEHLQASLDCAHQAASAVKRIVSFACRPEIPRPRQPMSLAVVVEEVVERVRARRLPGLTIQAVLEVPGLALADDLILRAALDQVINNALEAMPVGGTLLLHVGQVEGSCVLTVSDTGGGIPSDILPHLFRPFHTSKTSGHLGLGLVQARNLVQLLSGRIDVASVVGQGVTVTIVLPAWTDVGRSQDSTPGEDASV